MNRKGVKKQLSLHPKMFEEGQLDAHRIFAWGRASLSIGSNYI